MSARVQRPLELGAIRTARPARDLDPPVKAMNGVAGLGKTTTLRESMELLLVAMKRGGGAPGRWGGAEQQPAAGRRRGRGKGRRSIMAEGAEGEAEQGKLVATVGATAARRPTGLRPGSLDRRRREAEQTRSGIGLRGRWR